MKHGREMRGWLKSAPVLLLMMLVALPLEIGAQLPATGEEGNLESPFAKVYEKLSPAVVLVQVESTVERRGTNNDIPFFFNIPDREQEQRGMGSGVIVDREGHVLTNDHVIRNPRNDSVADHIRVTLGEGVTYDAEVVGRDPNTDIAVIQLDLEGELLDQSQVAELGDSDTLKPGDYAIAIGNPLGLERSITVGVISAVGRWNMPNPMGAEELTYKNFIQTDAQINPGNSGGALADINGRVVGINDMYTARFAGIGFAIPINLARNVMEQLIATGTVKRGFLGLRGTDIDRDIQEAKGLDSTNGVLIDHVEEGYPAQDAGIERGDVIVSLNNETIRNYNDFLFKIANNRPGETVRLGVIQNGQEKTIPVTLADRDDWTAEAGPQGSESWRGIQVEDVRSNSAQQFNLEGIDEGVVIVGIGENSPAADANLSPGDVIVEINDRSIDSLDDFQSVKQEFSNTNKPILIFRLRRMSNGYIERGFVAVKSE